MCVSENVSVTLDIVLDIALCLQLPRMIRSSHGHVCSSSHCVRAARLKYIPTPIVSSSAEKPRFSQVHCYPSPRSLEFPHVTYDLLLSTYLSLFLLHLVLSFIPHNTM